MKKTVRLDASSGAVVKTVHRDRLDLELTMSREAHRIATGQQTFNVPKVLDSDLDTGTISFEYYPHLSSLRSHLRDLEKSAALIDMAAQSLAYIHNNIDLDTKIELPRELRLPESAGTAVFLHGDFNLDNIQVDEYTGKLVIMDWSLTPLAGTVANWGTRYWDVGWMVSSIFVMSPQFSVGRKSRESLADLFIETYVDSSGVDFKYHAFATYLQRLHFIFSAKVRDRSGWRYLKQWWKRKCMLRYARRLDASE